MGFHWYIDIEESATGQNFSAGPIIFTPNQAMTVSDFVDKVNTAFLNAYATHGTLYSISARILPLVGGFGPEGVPEGSHLHIGATSAQEIVHEDHHQPQVEHSHQGGSGENLLWPSAEEVLGYGTAGTPNTVEFTQAQSSRQFIVQYRIDNNAGNSFKLRFATGDHGQTSMLTGVAAGGEPPRAQITVTNTSNAQPLVLDHCKITALITDKPPVPPDMWFVPYKGINDRMLILFGPNVGTRTAKPVLLATSDSTFIIEEYYSQKELIVDPSNLGAIEETLEYASDDPVRTYQIFRMDTMPTSYSSFIDHHLATVEEQLTPQKYSTGASYLETLLPNVKYYYCGRSIDRHQNISNPTPVTELELVDNNGQLFFNKKIFTFPTIPQRPSLSARRLLAIEPAQLQQAYSLETSTIGAGQAVIGTAPPSNEIGAAADAVWDQKFKIRLTSQKTGKKIDLNITFKNTGVANP